MKHTLLQTTARFLARHPRWMAAGAILYFLSPWDLVPEALVGPLGYLDDLVVLLLPYVILEYVRRHKDPPEIIDTTARPERD